MYLIDSSILIRYLRKDTRAYQLFSQIPAQQAFVSEIIALELLVGVRSKKQQGQTDNLLKSLQRINIDQKITAQAAALIVKHPTIFDKKRPHSFFDALIAATAIVHHLTLLSLNIRHFAKLEHPGLKLKIYSDKQKQWRG